MRSKRQRQIYAFFSFFEEMVPTAKHPGVSHCPHLYKQPQPVDHSSACLGVARLALLVSTRQPTEKVFAKRGGERERDSTSASGYPFAKEKKKHIKASESFERRN